MCELTPCGNCIIHSGPYSERDEWGQIDTCSTGRRFGGSSTTTASTTTSRNKIECHTCGQVFTPIPREYC